VIAIVWLLFKVGKLTGAYTEKLKSQVK